MKFLMSALIALTSLSTFANTVYLDGANIDLAGNTATLIKTTNTPTSINLKVTVPTTIERCADADIRVDRRTVTSGSQCGYDSVAYRCGGVIIRTPRYNPRRGGVVRGRGGRGRVSVPVGRRYNPRRVQTNICYENVARTCTVTERYCVNPQYVTVDKVNNFKLTFSKFKADAEIEFSLDQNQNLTLDVTNMASSCVKKTVYKKGSVKTGAKLKLKRRCR